MILRRRISGVCRKLCSFFIRHLSLFTMHLWKTLYFSALLSKVLFTFALAVFWLNNDLHVVFYVGFRNFRKTNTENQSVKNKKHSPTEDNPNFFEMLHIGAKMLSMGRFEISRQSGVVVVLTRESHLNQ